MRRYSHYLTRATGNVWPQSVICVDCVPIVDAATVCQGRLTERLDSWHAVTMRRCEDTYQPMATISSRSESEWWHRLAEYAHYTGSVWILSYRCGSVWSLLDLWGALEHGHVHLSGESARQGAASVDAVSRVRKASSNPLGRVSMGAVRRMQEAAAGCLCIEDPPCIASLRCAGQPAAITWVDCRNYGATPPATATPGPLLARWLADWIAGAAVVLARLGSGSLKTTAGAQALSMYRHTYYAGGIHAHTHSGGGRIEDAAYIGGRCEARRIGPATALSHHVDYRSQYTAVMRDTRLPVRLRRHHHSGVSAASVKDIDPDTTIATVKIESDEPAYPYRQGHIVIYPIGRYVTTLCGPELRDAVDRGRVHGVIEWCTYHMDYALRAYAEALYHERCLCESRGDRDGASLVKRLANVVVGKMGQRSRTWTAAPAIATDMVYGSWLGVDDSGGTCRYRVVAGIVQRDTLLGSAPDAVPAVAAWITSAARVRLLGAIRCAGWDQTHYYDTDSLVVSALGYARLRAAGRVQRAALGELQDVHASTTCVIYGVKHYVFGDKLTCSGLPRGHCEDVGDGHHYWYWRTPASSVSHGRRPESGRVLRRYKRQREYRHGVVADDGTVSPHVLSEW